MRARPQSAVVVSKDGHTATFKGDSVIHSRGDDDWDELTRWFYPALAGVDPRSGDPFRRQPAAVSRRPAPGHHRKPRPAWS